jgi:hypothetical protein
MLGLVGTVGGAIALEVRRIRRKGGPDEVKEVKKRERELRELLEVRWWPSQADGFYSSFGVQSTSQLQRHAFVASTH